MVNTALLAFIVATAGGVVSPVTDNIIPGMLVNYCVGGQLCRARESANSSEENLRDLSKVTLPCCTACSCDADCEQTHCCLKDRPEQDQTMRTNQQCLYTTTKQPDERNRHLYLSYYMVTEPPLRGCRENLTYTDMSPSAKVEGTATTLHNFHPVSSKTSGKIYKNVTLAICYGDEDILPWVPVFACTKYGETVNNLDVTSHALSILDLDKYPQCQVSFIYPGDKSNIESDRCYIDIIDTCSYPSFSIPDGTNMSREEIIEACEGGFLSPYLLKGMYANVFCHICNGRSFIDIRWCPDRYGDDGPLAFTWILKMDVEINMKASAKGNRLACPTKKSQKDQCRVLHCPTGKLLTNNKTCVWPFIETSRRAVYINLKLTPTKILTDDDLRNGLNLDEKHAYPAGLSRTWPKGWNLTYLAYFPRKCPNISTVDMFLAKLQVYSNSPHDILLKTITKNMQETWQWDIAGKRVDLIQEFAPQTKPDSIDIRKQYYSFINIYRTGIEAREEAVIYSSGGVESTPLEITKLFFCDQIEMVDDEFTLNSDNTILTLNKSGRIFLDAEFGLIENNKMRVSARVCLADSNFNERLTKSSVGLKTASLIYIVATSATILLAI